MSLEDRPPKVRWRRGHRFTLSDRGRDAEREYRETIVSARDQPGRVAFDSARAAWAKTHGLNADDGLYLVELADGVATLAQLVAALESCGKSKVDALASLDRLADAGLITPPDAA